MYSRESTGVRGLEKTDPVFYKDNFRKVWRVVEVLRQIAVKYGKTPAQVALNWLITYSPLIVPILVLRSLSMLSIMLVQGVGGSIIVIGGCWMRWVRR